jgi:hypothetical protein
VASAKNRPTHACGVPRLLLPPRLSLPASHTSLAAVFPLRFRGANLSEPRNTRHSQHTRQSDAAAKRRHTCPSDAVMADGKKSLTVSAHSGREATERKRRHESACLELLLTARRLMCLHWLCRLP